MPELIGGHQFAIPGVNTIKTSDYTQAIGGIGFGGKGEMYRVMYLNESSTFTAAVGALVFLETASVGVAMTAAGQTGATIAAPYLCQTASGSNIWAGVLISSARGQGLALVQVGGLFTMTLTASSQAVGTDSVVMFVPANNTGVASAALALIAGAAAFLNPPWTTSISTVAALMFPAPMLAF